MSACTFSPAHRCSGTRMAAPELDPKQIGFGKRRVCAGQLTADASDQTPPLAPPYRASSRAGPMGQPNTCAYGDLRRSRMRFDLRDGRCPPETRGSRCGRGCLAGLSLLTGTDRSVDSSGEGGDEVPAGLLAVPARLGADAAVVVHPGVLLALVTAGLARGGAGLQDGAGAVSYTH